MKKQYMKPTLVEQLIENEYNLLAGSGETGTKVYTETEVSNVTGLARSNYSGWDDDDE